nr:hypothetical protein [Clostridia bacterium]
YQNISIITANNQKYAVCKTFTEYLLNRKDVETLGLISVGSDVYYEELSSLREVQFEFTLSCPCGEDYISQLKSAAKNGDLNKIKTMLK